MLSFVAINGRFYIWSIEYIREAVAGDCADGASRRAYRLLCCYGLLVKLKHVDVEYGQVFALQLVLLGLHQVGLAGHQLHDVLQTEPELFAEQFVTRLLIGRGHLCCLELALVGGGIYPEGLNGVVECLLLVFQVEEIALALKTGLVEGC